MITIARLRKPLRDIQTIHGIVRGSVPDTERPLWAQPVSDLIIIQTTTRPDLPSKIIRESTSAAAWVPQGRTRASLSLIACPTRVVDHHRRTLPVDLWPDWFARKLDGAVDLDEIRAEYLGPRVGRRGSMTVTHVWVAFDATGTITDPGRLTTIQQQGIGPGKAYGAGLLLAAPARGQQ